VCIAASAIGVILLIIDAVRERSMREADGELADRDAESAPAFDEEYPEHADDVPAETHEASAEHADDETVDEEHKSR
jgi:hypothetical protein